jgi:predicted lipoprotein with Yx(FWY)xxD motif
MMAGTMTRTRRLTLALVSAGVAVFATAALASANTAVSTKHTSLGTILVTASGRTLYLDSADRAGHFACTNSCLKVWPPLKAVGALRASGSAKASLLRKAKGPAGEVVTYAGHPLYTFVSDTTAKPTSGEGQHGFYAVSPTGSKAAAPSSGQTKKPSSRPPGY